MTSFTCIYQVYTHHIVILVWNNRNLITNLCQVTHPELQSHWHLCFISDQLLYSEMGFATSTFDVLLLPSGGHISIGNDKLDIYISFWAPAYFMCFWWPVMDQWKNALEYNMNLKIFYLHLDKVILYNFYNFRIPIKMQKEWLIIPLYHWLVSLPS